MNPLKQQQNPTCKVPCLLKFNRAEIDVIFDKTAVCSQYLREKAALSLAPCIMVTFFLPTPIPSRGSGRAPKDTPLREVYGTPLAPKEEEFS